MDSENTPKEEFGKVIDALHNKEHKLSSLRTYQGDMAEFIKSKNESVISVVVKEKERKEEREEKIKKEEKLEMPQRPASQKSSFQINFTMILLSLFLVGGGVLAFMYIFKSADKEPVALVVNSKEIIPYNSLVTLANVTSGSLGGQLGKLPISNGTSVLKISDTNGGLFQKAGDFFDFLGVEIPATLKRTLKDGYGIGMISQNNENSFFIVITVKDFGQAFAGMLDWEASMPSNLSFLSTGVNMATSTEVFSWKDIIVKNKDTRGFTNSKGQSKIAYTFLDKNTILIVGNLSIIGDISSAYASRSVAR